MSFPEEIAKGCFSITPNDSTTFTDNAFGIYVGGDGDVKVDTLDGDEVTFSGAKAGTTLPVIATKVYATGTTATNLLGYREPR